MKTNNMVTNSIIETLLDSNHPKERRSAALDLLGRISQGKAIVSSVFDNAWVVDAILITYRNDVFKFFNYEDNRYITEVEIIRK